jgi:hypothetical protein
MRIAENTEHTLHGPFVEKEPDLPRPHIVLGENELVNILKKLGIATTILRRVGLDADWAPTSGTETAKKQNGDGDEARKTP